ncbi:MAG TPA: PKD domain-containing protein, partial [Bacteroidales bacterium]|nr:PKD domain-containing protein [Bacteroidales bacterium]
MKKIALLSWLFSHLALQIFAQSSQFTSDSPRCKGDTIHFYPASPGGTILSETWDFGDGTVTTYLPPVSFPVYAVHLFPWAGFYSVSRTVTFTGGPVSSTLNVWVNAPPVAAFMAMYTATCEDQPVHFTDFSVSNGMGVINQWKWEYGDGTPPLIAVWPTNLNFDHTFANSGTYPVILTVTDNNGCFDSVMHSVAIYPNPVPVISGEDTLCRGAQGVIYQTDAGMTGYQWTVSPGGVIQSGAGTQAISVNWPSAGNQWVAVSYTSPSGCAAATPTVLPVSIAIPPDSLNQLTNVTVGTGQSFCGDAGLTLLLA